MNRFLVTLALVLAASSPALAQDMPLSQILIDGEGWKKVREPGDKPLPPPDGPVLSYETYSPDRGTVYYALESALFVKAAPVRADGQIVSGGAPYAQLRLKRGEKMIGVTGLATDRDGRIYAATPIGVQVFDPTGRLCGVMTPAAEGSGDFLTFEGDTLTLWIGDDKYARKLNTSGAK